MSLISTWSTVANDNGTLGTTPFYWPEGQAPSTVNDCARLMMATIRSQWNDAQWFNWGYTIANVSGNSFTVVTASWNTVTVANVFATGGRIKLSDSIPNILYGTITTVSVSAASVLVSFTPDSNSLTSTVTSVFNSIITADQKSIPSSSVPANVVRQSGSQIYGVDGGSTDAYAISMTPTLNAYAAGESFNFKANTANTGAATLNIDGLGAKAIVNPDGSALNSAAIPAGSVNHVVFDGTNFQLVNYGGSGGGGGGSGGRLLSYTILTTGSGTYTKGPGINSLLVEVMGAGGGGGGAACTGNTASCAGGGGAGCYVRKWIVTASATYSYQVAAGGAGGAGSGASGSSGGTTTFGSLSAPGGGGGAGGTPTNTSQVYQGGAGGSGASGGDINQNGESGQQGVDLNSVGGGNGGNGYFQGSGEGGWVGYPAAGSPGVSAGGSASANSGAGGGGAAATSTISGTVSGGSGADGIIVVWEYS